MSAEMETLSYYCIKLTERKSFAWRYFGLLVKAEDYEQCVDTDHVYCSVCFQANLPNTPTSTSNIITLVKRYKRNVATGNLLLHLKKNHNVVPPLAEGNIIVDVFNHVKDANNKSPNRTSKQGETSKGNRNNDLLKLAHKGKAKNLICKDLALWFCRDMVPFSMSNGQGFVEFVKKYKILGGNELPEPKSVLKYAFNEIYDTTVMVMKKEIANCPKVVSLTLDIWTDVIKQLSFITFTLHFVSNSFVAKAFNLRTSVIPYPYKIQLIQNEIKKTVEEFDLKNNFIICISPEGTNISKACALTKIDYYNCLSHALHNLVVHDGISNSPEIMEVIIKAKLLVKHLTYRLTDLPREYRVQYEDIILKLIEVGEFLDADARLPLFEEAVPHKLPNMTVLNSMQDFPTTWTCISALVENVISYESVIISFLSILELNELMLKEMEWALLKEINEVLGSLRTASEILGGCKFASLNLALLFRAELMSSLQTTNMDSQILCKFKESMLLSVERRFPISELQLCSALFDPSLRGLQTIDEFLYQNNSSKESFLKKMYETYISTELEDILCENPLTPPIDPPSNWKRLKLELLQKHTGSHRVGIEAEIQQYLSVTTAVEDPLLWWKDHESSFPRLACLAKYILSVPATSIPSERAFSVKGILWNEKKSNLSPAKLDKTLFIHENHDLIQSIV
ncbi:E3 SUMO-protein ligase ZBED1-like [Centruroides vittatus]|uniref:E3 SUMO-protein ligase ZBED1-like n=1 Tax=Centruroides vittatus TaxID=120091 RepID=UPI0035105225